jgi:hypothetical protein
MYKAFVVNVINNVNLDIDIIGYDGSALSCNYTYEVEGKEFTARAYRCRAKNIKKLQNYTNKEDRKNYNNIIFHINYLDGWVLIDVKGIDKHGRLLVDIYDPITKDNIINKYLLQGKGTYTKYK